MSLKRPDAPRAQQKIGGTRSKDEERKSTTEAPNAKQAQLEKNVMTRNKKRDKVSGPANKHSTKQTRLGSEGPHNHTHAHARTHALLVAALSLIPRY